MTFRIGRNDNNRSKKWFAIFVGALMLMSVVGFVFSLNPSAQGAGFRYGGLVFQQDTQGFYTADVEGKQVDFFYRPDDVAGIELPSGAVRLITGSRAAYITYDWNSSRSELMALFQFDTAILLEKKWGVFVQPGFSTSNPMNASIVGCAEATGFVPVILLEAANNTGIRLDSSNSNCIVVGGDSDTGFLMAADRLKYAILQGGEK